MQFWALSQARKDWICFGEKRGCLWRKKYQEDFDAYVATIKSYGGSVKYKEWQIKAELKRSATDPKKPMHNEIKDAKLPVKKGMSVKMFIGGTNNELFGDLKDELISNLSKGVDNLPVNLDEAVQLMNAYKTKKTPCH